MRLTQKNFDQIRTDFERQNGWLLRQLLTNHQYLVRQYLPDFPSHTTMGFEARSFDWLSFSEAQSPDESDVYTISTNFAVTGDIIIYKELIETSSVTITLSLVAVIPCRHILKSDMLIYNERQITIMNDELQKIHSFEEVVMKQFVSLTQLGSIDRDLMDRIWPLVDNNNEKQVYVSGWDYLNDIDNVYRQTKYLIALANTYSNYANRYFQSEVRMPPGYHALNFTACDRRYLDYCTYAIQSLYVFWERIAFLVYQFYQPTRLKENRVSFKTLVTGIIADQKTGSNVKWFEDFLKAEHQNIQALRHPLVHYEFNPIDLKGSYVPTIHAKWVTNNKNHRFLEQLETESRNLLQTITSITEKCPEGYARAIALISDLNT